MDFLKSTEVGDPLGRQGVESLIGGGGRPPSVNPPLIYHIKALLVLIRTTL